MNKFWFIACFLCKTAPYFLQNSLGIVSSIRSVSIDSFIFRKVSQCNMTHLMSIRHLFYTSDSHIVRVKFFSFQQDKLNWINVIYRTTFQVENKSTNGNVPYFLKLGIGLSFKVLHT